MKDRESYRAKMREVHEAYLKTPLRALAREEKAPLAEILLAVASILKEEDSLAKAP